MPHPVRELVEQPDLINMSMRNRVEVSKKDISRTEVERRPIVKKVAPLSDEEMIKLYGEK